MSAEVKTTTCYMCACLCGIRVHLKDVEIRYIDGNPDHALNKGVPSAKGASGIMKQYSPARLTQPLLHMQADGRRKGTIIQREGRDGLVTATRRGVDAGQKLTIKRG